MGVSAIKKQASVTNWAQMVRADDSDVERANSQLKQLIAAGANGVAMVFEGAHNAYSYGLPARGDTITQLLQGIDLQGLHLRLDNHPHGAMISNQFVEFLQQNSHQLQTTKITFGIDPTASLASCGKLKMSLKALKAYQPQSMSAFFAAGLPGIILEADGRPYHNAGADVAQEIGAMLCVADEHLNMVEAGRHPIDHALPHIGFATALDSDIAAGIAKLRVLTLLWRRLQKNRHIKKPITAPIHVETSRRMLDPRNIALNQARNHCAAVAAVAGGAVSLSILPPATPLGLPAAPSRLTALMSGLVLAQENNDLYHYAPAQNAKIRFLDKKCDENKKLEDLSRQAWAHYQAFKAAKGVMACLIDGSLAAQFHEAHERRLASREKIVPPASLSFEQHGADIYDIDPINPTIDGIVHCQPLVPIYELAHVKTR